MTALIAEMTLRMTGRKITMRVVGVVAALGLVTACTTSDSGGPSNLVLTAVANTPAVGNPTSFTCASLVISEQSQSKGAMKMLSTVF